MFKRENNQDISVLEPANNTTNQDSIGELLSPFSIHYLCD